MSETPSGVESGEAQAEQGGDESQTFSKEYVDKLRREAAKYRTDAKAGSEAIARLAQLEESQKSEAQKLAERAEAAEARAQQAERNALRLRIAAKHGVSDEDADLFLTGSDEETLTRQAERLAARAEESTRPRSPQPDPHQGRSGAAPASAAEQFAAAIAPHFTT